VWHGIEALEGPGGARKDRAGRTGVSLNAGRSVNGKCGAEKVVSLHDEDGHPRLIHVKLLSARPSINLNQYLAAVN
jgi:hypothetical protein